MRLFLRETTGLSGTMLLSILFYLVVLVGRLFALDDMKKLVEKLVCSGFR